MLSVILPTYNEAENLGPLIDRVERQRASLPEGELEVIIVDDASPDGTARIAELQDRAYGNVRLVRRPKRMGLASAILRGIEEARGDVLAVMDADLQHPPELLPAAARRLREGADLVVFSRFAERGGVVRRSALRAFLSRAAIALTHLLLAETRALSDPLSGFFVLRAELLRGQSFRGLGYKLLPEIVVRKSFMRLEEMPFTFGPRAAGKSKMSLGAGWSYLRLLVLLKRLSGRHPGLAPDSHPDAERELSLPRHPSSSGAAAALVLSPELVLRLGTSRIERGGFPTTALCKGLCLEYRGRDLSEEGVGFGVPLVKRGLKTVFPGALTFCEHTGAGGREVAVEFSLNLVERVSRSSGRSLHSRALYALTNGLAGLHRRCSWSRPALTALSSGLRRLLRLRTEFVPAPPGEEAGTVRVTYTLLEGNRGVQVAVDAAGLKPRGITELVLMNEQGAHYFELYRDSDGLTLPGNRIGTWDAVPAGEATLLAPTCGLAFSLRQLQGARLYRGRELEGSRLAWCGFGYVLPPGVKSFRYEIAVRRLP